MLKLGEKLEEINQKLKKEKSTKNTWREEITEKNKTLHFSATTRKTLEKEGLNLENLEGKNYIIYKNMPLHYNAIKSILENNSDIFRKTVK